MNLKEFVSESLEQIIAGVEAAQSAASKGEARVNPTDLAPLGATEGLVWDKKHGGLAEFIDFDVAVTTAASDSAKGGFGLFVGALGAGAQGTNSSSQQSTSRIRFRVPVMFPTQAKS